MLGQARGTLPNVEVSDYVMVAKVREPEALPKLVSTWTDPRRWCVRQKRAARVQCGEYCRWVV